jgi:undecaprenyl-diphosphatase
LVSARYRKLAVPAYLGATLIGVSRIYLGRHYPLDAAGGAVVGIASGYLVMRFQKPILAFEL